MSLLYSRASFDFTEMINLAVQMLRNDASEDVDAAAVQAHVPDNMRYVVVDEYQDLNPLQEQLVALRRQPLCRGRRRPNDAPVAGGRFSDIITFANRFEASVR